MTLRQNPIIFHHKIIRMKISFCAAIGMLCLVFACSTTKITNTWTAQNQRPQPYKKILVLGLINDPDVSIRGQMEISIADRLKQLGYNATCSCDEFGPKSFENLKESEALARLGNNGIDAVLTVVLLNKTRERYYVAENIHYSPYAVYQNSFWGYYSTMHERVFAPGYYVTDTRYFWETNFYNITRLTQLLYSAQSQSFDSPSTAKLTSEYANQIVKDLLKANIIADRSPKEPDR